MKVFKKLNYKTYFKKFELSKLMQKDFDKLLKTNCIGIKDRVDPNNNIPFGPDILDLIRLHYIVTIRKVSTILEFGVGESSLIFAHALKINKERYFDIFKNKLRKNNIFELHSVDNQRKWIDICKKKIPKYLNDITNFHFSKVITSTYNDKVCTFYERLPNICPDLIYLDGPDQFSSFGDIRGISTRNFDRMPMSADILAIEYFLQPGCIILVDGRTANARFLKNNLQRNWYYGYDNEFDLHYFELVEAPLGKINKLMLDFKNK